MMIAFHIVLLIFMDLTKQQVIDVPLQNVLFLVDVATTLYLEATEHLVIAFGIIV